MHWAFFTSAGLKTRIAIGVTIFLVLAIIDLKRNRSKARRWREYAFLLACVFAAMIYGAINDQVSSAISWEFFYYGKELDGVLGPTIPPDRAAMRWEAAKIGMGATWSMGALLAAALLIANNPRNREHAPLPLAFSRLFALVPIVLLITIVFSAIGCAAGWFGFLDWAQPDVYKMQEFRPRHFAAAWGEHLGAYVGGLIGGTVAVLLVLRNRKRSITSSLPDTSPPSHEDHL